MMLKAFLWVAGAVVFAVAPFVGIVLGYAIGSVLAGKLWQQIAPFAGILLAIPVGWWFIKRYIALFLYQIPANPPMKALTTWWGEREWLGEGVVKIKGEGVRFFAPFFPFNYSFIPIRAHVRNADFSSVVKSDPDGEAADVYLPASCTWTVDTETSKGRRLLEYLNVEEDRGVQNILLDYLLKYKREAAAKKKWAEIFKNTDPITDEIVEKLTETPDIRTDEDLRKRTAGKGDPDQLGLGIRVIRVVIKDPELRGKIKDVADRKAVEQRERDGELFEQETISLRAKEIKEKGDMNKQDAYDRALIATNPPEKALAYAAVSLKQEVAKLLGRLLGT